ncbi:hypothetical protein [Hydrococcus rivularis]|uniref:hypothetical protein n=1 Tax=Hydrococcus rivularis TaxID=1616834 RepID=UPI001C318FC3|nr:hypothetical protein [Hydrococcus rivularis]
MTVRPGRRVLRNGKYVEVESEFSPNFPNLPLREIICLLTLNESDRCKSEGTNKAMSTFRAWAKARIG